MAALAGSLANVAAFVFVNAMVADYLRRDDRGVDAAMESVRATWARRKDLGEALIRSFAIVFVLLVSVLGIPWAIRQLVRYQFIAHVVMGEGRSGKEALGRSSELVRHRWFHTAVIAAALNGAVGLVALVVALLILVIAAGLPIWMFSALVSLVYALVVPLAAIAMSLLHGDAVAERTGAPRAELVMAE